MLRNYKNANLIPLLEKIREPGRYGDLDGLDESERLNGVNALTNAEPDESYNKNEVIRELKRACCSGQEKSDDFKLEFSGKKQGLSYGLNPYTDWSLSLLDAPPTHYYLFLGLDWYSVSALIDANKTDQWFEYLDNPFTENSNYFGRIWAWILGSYNGKAWDTTNIKQRAENFIKEDKGGFIFHNLIPYLRPANVHSSGTQLNKRNWYDEEWKKKAVREHAVEDLRLLRDLANNNITTYCTRLSSVKTLVQNAGYQENRTFSWGAHPSRVFHPSTFKKSDLWFKRMK